MEIDDAILCLSHDATNEAAWEALYLGFWPYVLSIAFRILRCDRTTAEDVAQETFLRVLQRCPSFEFTNQRTFRGYLGMTARSVAIDAARKQKKEPSQLESDPILVSGDVTSDMKEVCAKLLTWLQPQDQQILGDVLAGLSIGDVSARTKLTRNNIGVRLHRIRKLLRERLQQ